MGIGLMGVPEKMLSGQSRKYWKSGKWDFGKITIWENGNSESGPRGFGFHLHFGELIRSGDFCKCGIVLSCMHKVIILFIYFVSKYYFHADEAALKF